jgi:hypothetical protein
MDHAGSATVAAATACAPGQPAQRFVDCPVSVLRIAGLPLAESRLPAGLAVTGMARLNAARAALDQQTGPVCDAIAALVPAAFAIDPAGARALLTIKRDLHNARLPRPAVIDACRDLVPDSVHSAAAALMGGIAAVAAAEQAYAAAHAQETADGLEQARTAAMRPEVLGAIAVTNGAVHARLLALADDAAALPEKIRAQTLLSAARYVLRAGQKTSPLSSFGVVALGWEATADASADVRGAVVQRREPSHAALDHALQAALSDLAALDGAALLGLNTTVEQAGRRFDWRRVEASPAGQRVRQAAITAVNSTSGFLTALARVVAHRGGVLTIDTLRQDLAPLRAAIGAAETETLLADAWRKGFLVPAVPADAEPLDRAVQHAALLGGGRAERLTGALRAYAGSARDPQQHVGATAQALRALFAEAGCAADAPEVRPALFEDCTIAGNTAAAIPTIGPAVRAALHSLLQISPMLSSDLPIARTRRFIVEAFKRRHGEGGALPRSRAFLHSVVDDLRAVLAGPQADGEAAFAAVRAASPLHDQLLRGREQFLDALAQSALSGAAGAPAIVPPGVVTDAIAALPAQTRAQMVSQMFFLQALPGDPDADHVLNAIYPGGASTFSRFIAPDSAAHAGISAYLDEISAGLEPMEIAGGFGFNAAWHPPYTARRAAIPPYMAPGESIIDVGQLGLRHRPETDDLVFHDPARGDIAIHYAAILNPLMLPLDFQVVRALSPFGELITNLAEPILDRLPVAADGSRSLPRLVFQRLVLARAQQMVPHSLLPDPALAPALFFAAFNQWADARGLPRFLFASRRRAGRTETDTRAVPDSRARRAIKPLPLDRWSPLAVLLLQREIATDAGEIALVEALPRPDQTAVTRHGQPVVAEYAFEMSMLASAQGTP